MKLSPEERRHRRQRFQQMRPREKWEHIWTYYKAPIFLAVAVLVLLLSGAHRALTKKEPALYIACINVAAGDTLEQQLSDRYFSFAGLDPHRYQLLFYRDLYLSENPSAMDHEYAYASRMKVLAAINAKQLDLVLMNREAYDLCSGSGYLMELDTLFSEANPQKKALLPLLTENLVILEDNAIEFSLNQAAEYQTVTYPAVNALDLSGLSVFAQAGFSDRVYLGIVANTPRLAACEDFLLSLTDSPQIIP